MCGKFGKCGGCVYLNIPYEEELAKKEAEVRGLLAPFVGENDFLPIIPAPSPSGYRNKMELAFGDEGLDGALSLGIRNRRSMYEVSTTDECALMPEDFKLIAKSALEYFRGTEEKFYHRRKRTGSLRHLVLRRGEFTGELLVNLVTASSLSTPLDDFTNTLLALPLAGKIKGVLHTVTDSVADAISNENVSLLYGEDFFYEKINGLTFKVTAFSFFQTNSAGAEKLYEAVRDFASRRGLTNEAGDSAAGCGSINEARDSASGVNGEQYKRVQTKAGNVYDLYCGTGTIAQILARDFEKVTGVELNEAAVLAARENADMNGCGNCEFIAGDVLKFVDDMAGSIANNRRGSADEPIVFRNGLTGSGATVVLDPPRDGLHPKALEKIIMLKPPRMVYVSCKPKSLARDLNLLTAGGYKVLKAVCADMFPRTAHVETVVLLSE